METTILETPQAFGVLRLVADNPGSTMGYIANLNTGRKGRDRTREVRLLDLVEAGLIEARDDVFKNQPCKRYYLTARGDQFMLILALIEKL